jgi:hypothetical protein
MIEYGVVCQEREGIISRLHRVRVRVRVPPINAFHSGMTSEKVGGAMPLS